MSEDIDALLLELATRVRDAEERAGAGEEGSGEGTKAAPAQSENSTIKAIRAEAKRAEKRAAEAEAELADLRKFREETTARAHEAVLAAAGLTPQQAALYLKAGEEVTEEAVQKFKSEVLGVREDAEEEGMVDSAPFAPAGSASERLAKPIEGDAVKAYVEKHGPEAAAKAWAEGKLKL